MDTPAMVAALALGLAGSIWAQAPAYDATSLNGTYSYSISGYAYDPNTRANDQIVEAGQFTADGAGNVSGSDTVMISGGLVRRTFVGNYSINPDGTGTLVFYPSWGPAIHADLALGSGGHIAKLVVTDDGSTLSGVIESRQASRQSAPEGGYNASTLNTGYQYQLAGAAIDFFGNVTPISEAGRMNFDGAGNVSGSSTVSVNGYIVRRTFGGNYTVNPDGSGTFTLYPSWGPPINADLFLSGDGLKVQFILTDGGNSMLGTITAQTAGSR
jgi:hypothetical protein